MMWFEYKAFAIGFFFALGVVVTGGLLSNQAQAGSVEQGSGYESWQHRRLFDPSREELQAEARGQIEIYDGMTDRDAKLAMAEQSDRVESMMFIRTQATDDSGEAYDYEDDGCD